MYIDWWNRSGPATLGERFGLKAKGPTKEGVKDLNLVNKVLQENNIKPEKPRYEDEARSKEPRRYASYDPEIDNAIMALEYWNDRWLAHPLRNKFRTLKEFISWSMSNEDQPFNRGGIVSMLRVI